AAGARLMIDRADPQGVRLAIAAMRYQLGLVAERYAGPRFARDRTALLAGSRQLQAIGEIADPREARLVLDRWKRGFDAGLARRLRGAEVRSLYDRKRLDRALR
ncbi:MAG TPA: hypothetical protein VN034_03575, partial [Sphingopyxis sp.]|nr:hypothetical protein [Sphingopyxis sp.]